MLPFKCAIWWVWQVNPRVQPHKDDTPKMFPHTPSSQSLHSSPRQPLIGLLWLFVSFAYSRKSDDDYEFLCVWLFLLSIWVVRLIYGVECIRGSIAEQYSVVCIYYNLFILSPVGGHFHSFHGCYEKSCYICTQIFVYICGHMFLQLLGKYQGVVVLSHMLNVF